MQISGIRNTLPATLLAFALGVSLPIEAKMLLFKQSLDAVLAPASLGHLMDLKGAWSLAASTSSDLKLDNPAYLLNAVLPLSTNPDSLLHGYYIAPTYIYTNGEDEGRLNFLGNKGWQVALGRGNLAFPGSIYRGFMQVGYRALDLNDDQPTTNVKNNFALVDEKKRSFIVSTGVSSTQNSLVKQRRPSLDSELLISLRYDYDEGDFFTHAKASLFYPTWLELGFAVAWFKVFTENANPIFDEVSDDFIFGPRIRGRAWEHLACDFSLDWHTYRDFDGKITIPTPKAQASVILNF